MESSDNNPLPETMLSQIYVVKFSSKLYSRFWKYKILDIRRVKNFWDVEPWGSKPLLESMMTKFTDAILPV